MSIVVSDSTNTTIGGVPGERMLKGEDTRPGKYRSRLVPGQKTGAMFNRQIRTDWDSFNVAGSVKSIVPILASKVFHAACVSHLKCRLIALSLPGELESESNQGLVRLWRHANNRQCPVRRQRSRGRHASLTVQIRYFLPIPTPSASEEFARFPRSPAR